MLNTPTCLVVTREPLLGWALRAFLLQELRFEECVVADSAPVALAAQQEREPDLVILAGDTGNDGPARLMRELRRQRRGQAILVYDGALDADTARRALQAGMRGWLTREDDLAELRAAVSAVLQGDLHLSRLAADGLEGIFTLGPPAEGQPAAARLNGLSEREGEVLRLMGRGLRCKEIATRLGISPKTVETHQQRMRGKLKVKSSADLARLAPAEVKKEDRRRRAEGRRQKVEGRG